MQTIPTKILNPQRLYNLDVLKATTSGDDEFFVKILSTFLKNNQEALVRIKQSFKMQRYLDVGEAAHKMLSSYKHLEVKSLIPTLSELEGLVNGSVLEEEEMKDMIDYLSEVSEQLFGELQAEIDRVK